jgi:hypothetical protein
MTAFSLFLSNESLYAKSLPQATGARRLDVFLLCDLCALCGENGPCSPHLRQSSAARPDVSAPEPHATG